MSFLFLKVEEQDNNLKFAYLQTTQNLKPIGNDVLFFDKDKARIKDILSNEDNEIFGWSIYKDCKLLLKHLEENGEELIDFECFDIRYMLNVICMDDEEFNLLDFIPLHKQKDYFQDRLLNECYYMLLAFKNMLFVLNENVDSFFERHDFDSCFYYSLDAYYGKKGTDITVIDKVNKIESLFSKGIEKFIFFDFECANCFNQVGKICEVGIVITDTSFNVKEEIHYPINPNSPFHLLSKSGIGLHLYWEANNYKVYRSAPSLPFYYDSLRKILNDEHALCFGHSVNNDLEFLESDSKRNSLDVFEGYAVDTQKMYMYLVDKQMSSISLENAFKNLLGEEGMKKYVAHKSLDDSKMTMDIARKMLEESNMNIQELLIKHPKCLKETNKKTDINVIPQGYNFPEPNCNKTIDLANPESLYAGIRCSSLGERLYYEAVVEDTEKVKMAAFNGRKYAIVSKARKLPSDELKEIINEIRKRNGVIVGYKDFPECNFCVNKEDGKMTFYHHVPLSSKKKKQFS